MAMNKYDREHLRRVVAYQRKIDAIYRRAVDEAARLGVALDVPDDGMLNLDALPLTRRAIADLLREVHDSVTATVTDGILQEGELSNEKNDALVAAMLPADMRPPRYYRSNDDARDAFLARQEQGLDLSDRVWRYTDMFKSEIEMGLDCGIRDGLDAPAMARQLKQYLRFPDKLFRRVRDEHGNLQLSRAAADFHPGRGVYRSSYKNARRLAATETNIAYRTADYERWQQLDFVVGIEIHLSNNHTCLGKDGKPHAFTDICDQLQGKYPKQFKFTGWHPHCRCFATSILKTMDEMDAMADDILAGEDTDTDSVNEVTDMPDNFMQWVEDNQERIDAAQSLPYFLRDNAELMNPSGEIAGSMVGNRIKSFFEHLTLKEDTAAEQSATAFTAEQKRNHDEVSTAIGIAQGERMSFANADSGKTNPKYSWFAEALGIHDPYNVNCTITVATHELRMRGWDVTALPLDVGNKTMMKMFRGDTNAIWINPATGNPPISSHVSGRTLQKTMRRFDEQTAAVGRYHISFLWENGQGHILCVDRLPNGQMRVYDPQSNLLNVTDWMNHINLKRGLRVVKVDGMLINPNIGNIVKPR